MIIENIQCQMWLQETLLYYKMAATACYKTTAEHLRLSISWRNHMLINY